MNEGDSVDQELAGWMDRLPGVDPSVEATSQRVRRSSRVLGLMLTRIAAESELTIGDWETLSVLQRSGASHESSPKEIAAELGVTSGTMSVRIERLVRAGLIEPGTVQSDKRSRPVRLTDRGSRIWRRATKRRTDYEQRLITNALDAEEITALNALLRKLLSELEGEFGPAPSHGSLRREAG